jgi:hypothetical protein
MRIDAPFPDLCFILRLAVQTPLLRSPLPRCALPRSRGGSLGRVLRGSGSAARCRFLVVAVAVFHDHRRAAQRVHAVVAHAAQPHGGQQAPVGATSASRKNNSKKVPIRCAPLEGTEAARAQHGDVAVGSVRVVDRQRAGQAAHVRAQDVRLQARGRHAQALRVRRVARQLRRVPAGRRVRQRAARGG